MDLYAFKPNQRLLTSKQFKSAFDNTAYRFSTPVLLVLAAKQATNKPARLGLVVSKKHLKLAVDRNRFKRVARESFRLHQQQLVGLDLIVLVRPGAKKSTKQEIYQILEKAWPYIIRKRDKQMEQDQ